MIELKSAGATDVFPEHIFNRTMIELKWTNAGKNGMSGLIFNRTMIELK